MYELVVIYCTVGNEFVLLLLPESETNLESSVEVVIAMGFSKLATCTYKTNFLRIQ